MKFLRDMIGKKDRHHEVDEMVDEFVQPHKQHHEFDPAEDEDIYACLESIQSRLKTQDTDRQPPPARPEKMDEPKEDTVDHLVDLVAEMAPATRKPEPPVVNESSGAETAHPRGARTVPEEPPTPEPVATPVHTPVASTQAAPVAKPRPVSELDLRQRPTTFRPTPEPETRGPETPEPKATRPETTRPKATRPEATEPKATRPETPEPKAARPEKPAPAPAQTARAEDAPAQPPARTAPATANDHAARERRAQTPAREHPKETAAREHSAATPPVDAVAADVQATASAPGLVDIPAPAAGRSGRRAGRVKTRLLGFEHAGDIAADPFAKPAQPGAKQGMEFPVGWIVVTKGPGRGMSFALSNGVSKIGRGDDQAIRLDFGDTSISRDNHAAIAYDDERRMFFLGHGGKANLVRLNENPVLSTVELTHGDTIRIGETTLRFIAFCGRDFDWNAEAGDSSEHAAIA